MLRPADTQLEAIISSTHRVLRVGQVCFVPWVILDHVTPRHGVLAAIELGQVKGTGLGQVVVVFFYLGRVALD